MISNYTSTAPISALTNYCSDTNWQLYDKQLCFPEHYSHPYHIRFLDYIKSFNLNGVSCILVIQEPIYYATMYNPDTVTFSYYPQNVF